MDLDIRTLFIVNIFIALIVSIVMLIIWRAQKYSSSLGWISLGFACLMFSVFLISNSDDLSPFTSIILANSMLLIWVICVWQGTRDFQGLVFPLKSVLFSFLVFICSSAYYTYINFDSCMQVVVVSLFVISYSMLTINVLLKPIHVNSPSIEHNYTVSIVLFFIFFTLARMVCALIEKFANDPVSFDWIQQISLLSIVLYSVAFALGYLWVLQRNITNQIAGRAESLKAAQMLTEQLRQDAEYAALHDPLTLVGNRRKFACNANLERERHLRHHHSLCIAFIDIDYFKKINDKHGHDVGDQVLKSLVTLFTDIIRNIDMVYRWGEEFIILLLETSLTKALLVCERIREHIQANMKGEPTFRTGK